MILSILFALAGYSLVYVGMAFNSRHILPAFPNGWRVLTAQLTVFICANFLFSQLYMRERPTTAGTLTLLANVVCMITATCLMEWRAPSVAMLVASALVLSGGVIVVLYR